MTSHAPLDRNLIRKLLAESFKNLFAVKQRSFLALLGIVIGTAAVVAMLVIGHNAERETARTFDLMGAHLLVAQINSSGQSALGLSPHDVSTLPARLPTIHAAAPISMGQVAIGGSGQNVHVSILAVPTRVNEIADLHVMSGRLLGAQDAAHTFAVLGSEAATQLSADGSSAEPGDRLRVGRYVFTVVGVLAPTRPNTLFPVSIDSSLLIPLEGARRVMAPQINLAIVEMRPDQNDVEVAASVQTDLQSRGEGAEVSVESARQLVEALARQQDVHGQLLAAIGGVSLLVGGVGVMNVMLMSLMERRIEIGLRMAVGARPKDIRLMFMTEAAALSALGGVIGAFVGLIIAWLTAAVSGWVFSPAIYPFPLGAGVAAAIGLIFGIYPAIKAAQLEPITALRSD